MIWGFSVIGLGSGLNQVGLTPALHVGKKGTVQKSCRMRYAYPTCLSCNVFLKFNLLNKFWFLPEGYCGTFFTLHFFLVGWRFAYPTCLSCKVYLLFSLLAECWFLSEGFYGTLCEFILSDGAALIRPAGMRGFDL